MRKRYMFLTLVVIATSLVLITGYAGKVYSETDKTEETLSLIESGSADYENQRYLLALDKYKKATALINGIMVNAPGNKRAVLLKELAEMKIKECEAEINRIEGEIDSRFLSKQKLEEVYGVLEKADTDRIEKRYYLALQKYNEVKKALKSVLKEAPELGEAKLLSAVAEKRIGETRREMASLDPERAKENAFSEKLENIIDITEKAMTDEEAGKFLIALKKYSKAMRLLDGLEKDFPEKTMRISITKDMIGLKIDECREKIKNIEKEIETEEGLAIEVESLEVAQREEPELEAKPEAKPTPKRKPTTALPEKIREKPAPAISGKQLFVAKPKPKPEPEPEREQPGREQPKKVIAVKHERAPLGAYLARWITGIKNFVSSSKGATKEEQDKAHFANAERRSTIFSAIKERKENYRPPDVKKWAEGLSKKIKDLVVRSREDARPEATAAKAVNAERMSRVKKNVSSLFYAAKDATKEKITAFKNYINTRPQKKTQEAKIVFEVEKIKPLLIKEVETVIAEPSEERAEFEGIEDSGLVQKGPADTISDASDEVVIVEKTEGADRKWIDAKRAKPTGYDFTGFREDPDVTFSLDGERFKFSAPCLRKGSEIWVPIKEFCDKAGLTVLKPSDTTLIVIRYDGIPLEMNLGERDALVNKFKFLTMSKPLAIYNDTHMLNLDSVKEAFNISCEYFPDNNTVIITGKGSLSFSTFTMVKPPEVIAEEKRMPEVKPLPLLPTDMREELLPAEYEPDVDLRLDTTFRYYQDMLQHQRTRYNEYYLTGRMYGVDTYGHLSMRDFSRGEKRTWQEDAQSLSFFKDGAGIKLLDNYFQLPSVRTQSQSFWGVEFVNDRDPIKNNVWIGNLDPVSVPSLEGSNTLKYFTNLYAAKQEWIKTDTFNLSVLEMLTSSRTEFESDNATTDYPKKNFLYLIDTSWKARPDITLYNTFAQSTYVPDNEHNQIISDFDVKTGAAFTHERFSFDTYFEYVGDRYASVSIPTTYQDYMGWNARTNFRIAKNLNINISGDISRNNVAFNKNVPTSNSQSLSTGANLILPWEQSLNFSWNYNKYFTEGAGTSDDSGSEYNSYRVDYYKTLGPTASLQLGWQYYIRNPLASTTGGSYYDIYSFTVYKSFPELNGSYVRFYQDLTKTKELSISGSLPTRSVYNTDLSARYYILPYLSFFGDSRLRTTFQEQIPNSSILSLQAGVDYNAGPDTSFNVTYSVDNIELYDKYRTTDDWSILFYVRQIFDMGTPEKWGKVKVYVFEDVNGNDVMDKDDIGLSDILAYVINGRGLETNSKGMALIRKIVPGEREIAIDMRKLPVDMVIKGDATKKVLVRELKTSEVAFAIVTTGLIKGRVFVDVNNDGIFEKGADIPIPNARIFLRPYYMDTLSFSDGSYEFDYVYPGHYTVNLDQEGLPKEYKLSSPDVVETDVESKETVEDVDFIFETRSIKVKYF